LKAFIGPCKSITSAWYFEASWRTVSAHFANPSLQPGWLLSSWFTHVWSKGVNGGGTLLFPRGRFQMTATIELPPRSILRGEGAHLSHVYWPDTYEPVCGLPAALDDLPIGAGSAMLDRLSPGRR